MPKTLTGEELQLDDAPARDSELFLVDGNNLAYRAFFALPEELATSEGFSTNALLGFTNMLFKLLADYQPKGVAVAWDTRPVHRTELLETYKIERKPMPDLLREQFPHFRPIVEVAVAEGLHARPAVRRLLAEPLWHRLALDLVGHEQLRPVHGAGVAGDSDALRPVVGEELEEHVREPEQRIRREALARSELLG